MNEVIVFLPLVVKASAETNTGRLDQCQSFLRTQALRSAEAYRS
jgi:hypothetical protein